MVLHRLLRCAAFQLKSGMNDTVSQRHGCVAARPPRIAGAGTCRLEHPTPRRQP
jgi:hypothetical protein